MTLMCRRCQHLNPAEAQYCWFDGFALEGATPTAIGYRTFATPFVMPSGRECQDFDQLALACWNEWEDACQALRQGDLAKFMTRIGRADLAQAAQAGAQHPDPDQGLDAFLDRLPSKALRPAELVVTPPRWDLSLKPGEDHEFTLRLANQGQRLITGTLVFNDGNWLSVQAGANIQAKVFQFLSETEVTIHVRGKYLAARTQPQVAQVILDTNGGRSVIPVGLKVPVTPFPAGPLGGAQSPRQLIEKVRAHPREAAALFASGTVAKWYRANGWRYPVKGPAAAAAGAMDQFFQALGLPKPKMPAPPAPRPAAAAVAAPARAAAAAPVRPAAPAPAGVAVAPPRKAVAKKAPVALPSVPASVPLPVPAVKESGTGRAAAPPSWGAPLVELQPLEPPPASPAPRAFAPEAPPEPFAPPQPGASSAKRRWVLFVLLLLALAGLMIHDFLVEADARPKDGGRAMGRNLEARAGETPS